MADKILSAVLLALAVSVARPSLAEPAVKGLAPGFDAWQRAGLETIRGITLGPIESALHPNRGYGSDRCARSMQEARRMGATWISITPFGRVWDLKPSGISLSFEQPFAVNRSAVKQAIRQAHAEGMKVLLVPHLWVESGEWRALIDPGDDASWQRWAEAYRTFLLTWAEVARETATEMLSVGVELRSWVTSTRAASFIEIVKDVRKTYPGLLTYAGNWDDVEQTVILGELDVIGINAFYPLTEAPGASLSALLEGGRAISERVKRLAATWNKPLIFTEFGYTTRKDPALRPWEWPDRMTNVTVDELAQADAYRALLAPLIDEIWFAGFFAWRLYTDPEDMSQEAEWGFSPRGKLAELVLRDAFAARWANDDAGPPSPTLYRWASRAIGMY